MRAVVQRVASACVENRTVELRVMQKNYEVLLVSQFTLYGLKDFRKLTVQMLLKVNFTRSTDKQIHSSAIVLRSGYNVCL
ncbi:hypothetical protein SASPL_124069 [Salvia splendens]|uniref:Uncharacterized protein n=1 Tax=Salvia splendens TaxID=180675 RepID=A0A8X8XMK4_SALSN|nr:hypothetical protein SASPL_124069 [Salvia splendens]